MAAQAHQHVEPEQSGRCECRSVKLVMYVGREQTVPNPIGEDTFQKGVSTARLKTAVQATLEVTQGQTFSQHPTDATSGR